MTLLWCGFVGLYTFRLIKRHGWEYVPLVMLVFGAWLAFGSDVAGAISDGALLTAIGSVHLVTRRDILADGEFEAAP